MISDTALCVLDLRATCSDIKYAKEMAALMHAETGQARLVGQDNVPKIRDAFGAWAELRHRMIEAALDLDGGTDFLLDAAAGFGLRGLIFTEHPGKFCVEGDLPEMIKHKQNAVELLSGGVLRPNHKMTKLDVLNAVDWEQAARLFPKNVRLTIVIEGLLAFFSMEQKARALKNVSSTLQHFPRGARFISPDFYTIEEMRHSSEASAAFRKSVEEQTGTNIWDNAFTNVDDIAPLLYDCGFGSVRIMETNALYPIGRLKQQPAGMPRQFLLDQRMVIASL